MNVFFLSRMDYLLQILAEPEARAWSLFLRWHYVLQCLLIAYDLVSVGVSFVCVASPYRFYECWRAIRVLYERRERPLSEAIAPENDSLVCSWM